MVKENPTWGAPRIHGELSKLGIKISERTVARLMPRKRNPPSQTWRTFLDNHVKDLVSIDFFVVPTATFRVLGNHDRINGSCKGGRVSIFQFCAEIWILETRPRFLGRTFSRRAPCIHASLRRL